jgi:hypothetical protein
MRAAAQILLPVILPRAFVLWGLIRLVVAAVPMSGGETFGSIPTSPVGVILLCAVVGLIDVHVRGERILWANLGVAPGWLGVLYATAAIPAEILLAVIL